MPSELTWWTCDKGMTWATVAPMAHFPHKPGNPAVLLLSASIQMEWLAEHNCLSLEGLHFLALTTPYIIIKLSLGTNISYMFVWQLKYAWTQHLAKDRFLLPNRFVFSFEVYEILSTTELSFTNTRNAFCFSASWSSNSVLNLYQAIVTLKAALRCVRGIIS